MLSSLMNCHPEAKRRTHASSPPRCSVFRRAREWGKYCGSLQGILIGGCFASCLLMALGISPVRASGQAGSNGGNAAASKPAAPATGASQTTSASPASTGSTAATTAKAGAPTAQDIAAAKASAKVSVNTETGVYHTGRPLVRQDKEGEIQDRSRSQGCGI